MAAPSGSASADPLGTIGPYKPLSVLGEGGMGSVYLAEQSEPIRRRVALKIIKRGMDTKEVIARFESERQALALMSHPNIARVLDAGATKDGLPYFVMEHVAGIPITEYCDKNRLDGKARLELFGEVCEAVQHAHQKGIIHRDLKPSNVLVSEEDADSTPGTVNTVPLSLVAQWHPLGLGWFDPYIGAGGALVFVSDARLTPGGIAFSGVESVESHNKLAFVLNAGMRFRLFGPLGLVLDAKYLPFTFAGNFQFTSGLPGRSVTVKASQIDTFLGLSFRF